MRKGVSFWKCKCNCGNERIICGSDLKSGNTKSCGCIERERPNNTKHGMSYTRFGRIFKGMRKRCNSPNDYAYKRYGGRGIKLLWNSLEEFRDDMLESYNEHVIEYGEKNTTIDRYPNKNGNYCKENCRWATIKEQANNKRGCIMIGNISLTEYCIENGLVYHRIKQRIGKLGWSIEKALSIK